MRKTFVLALAAAAILPAALIATPAVAQDAPASPITVNGGATLVSDYRFRGISQTDKRFAVQGTLTVSHESGLYGTVWGSSIDDYVASGADQEIDFIVGYKKTIGGTTIDGGVLYYYYPGSGGANTDFVEPYLAADLSTAIPSTPLTLSAHFGHSFGPSYLTIGDEYSDWNIGATYTWKNLSFGVQYVDTDGTFITPKGRNASKAGVVASVGVAF